MLVDTRLEQQILILLAAHKAGKLGGEVMPEDARPALARDDEALYRYLTLPMALNYQRNSYQLWEAALKTWEDAATRWVFDPLHVAEAKTDVLRAALMKYKVALQPNKHPQTWQRICVAFGKHADGSVKTLLHARAHSVTSVKAWLVQHKQEVPYLGGPKIGNYWMYVLEQYTDVAWVDRACITIAPDTHVIQASEKLGLLTGAERTLPHVAALVAARWERVLEPMGLAPIDVHTPLWLWSRGGFLPLEGRR